MSESSRLFSDLEQALGKRAIRRLGESPGGVLAAAVLAPLFVKEGAPHLLFIKRPEGNYRHAGQIAFPGGKRDPTDRSNVDCALREAHEELGIAPADVKVLGELDEFDTVVSGFRVSPVVGVIPYPYRFRPEPAEVERMIEVPLRSLLDPANLRVEQREAFGTRRSIYYFSAGEDVIWGVTGAILLGLLEIIRELPNRSAGPSLACDSAR